MTTEVIGLRLTGDVSDLQAKLRQGGQAVEDFGRKSEQNLAQAARGHGHRDRARDHTDHHGAQHQQNEDRPQFPARSGRCGDV